MSRCRVTFRDVEHEIFRRVEVDSETALQAAQAALDWLLSERFLPEDFGPTVKVEVITTVEHTFPLRAITQKSLQVVKARVA